MADQRILDYRLQLEAGKGYFILQLENPGGSPTWTNWGNVSPAELGVIAIMLNGGDALYDFDKGVFKVGPPARPRAAVQDAQVPALKIEEFTYPRVKNK